MLSTDLDADPQAFFLPRTFAVAGLSEEQKLKFSLLVQNGADAFSERAELASQLWNLEERRRNRIAAIRTNGVGREEVMDLNRQIESLTIESKKWERILAKMAQEYNDAGFKDVEVNGFHVQRGNAEFAGYNVQGVGFENVLKSFIAAATQSSSGGLEPTYLELEILAWTPLVAGIGALALRRIAPRGLFPKTRIALGNKFKDYKLLTRRFMQKRFASSTYAHLRTNWTKHIDSIVDDLVASGRPKTMVLGAPEGGQANIRRFVTKEPSRMSEFLEYRPDSLNYSAHKKAGTFMPAMDDETLEFNLLLIERLHQRGFTFKVIAPESTRAANSTWLQKELKLLKRLGIKYDVIPQNVYEEILNLPDIAKWRPR